MAKQYTTLNYVLDNTDKVTVNSKAYTLIITRNPRGKTTLTLSKTSQGVIAKWVTTSNAQFAAMFRFAMGFLNADAK
ncbi:MAG: hypothetical protein ACO3O3_08655 [Ilumatobacteraceae bacterium]